MLSGGHVADRPPGRAGLRRAWALDEHWCCRRAESTGFGWGCLS